MLKHWRKPYWLDGELWWVGPVVLTVICFSNWWVAAYFAAPFYAPKETLKARGWEVPLFMCAGLSFLFGMALGHFSERIYDRSFLKPRRAKLEFVFTGSVGILCFGAMLYLSVTHLSPFSPLTFAIGGPLVWAIALLLVGVSMRVVES